MTLSDCCIELAIYRCLGDALLFVPAMCQPPREADAAFGPLFRAGTVEVDVNDAVWTPILEQIERHLFATVPREQGEMLVGADPMVRSERV